MSNFERDLQTQRLVLLDRLLKAEEPVRLCRRAHVPGLSEHVRWLSSTPVSRQ